MANRGQQSGTKSGRNTKPRYLDNEGLIPNLAKAVREVEKVAQRGKIQSSQRNKFLVIAILMREERTRVLETQVSEAERAETLKRLDGIAAILAQIAARDTSLIQLLESNEPLSPAAQEIRRDLLLKSGVQLEPDDLIVYSQEDEDQAQQAEKQVVPQSVIQRSMINPFLAPDLSKVAKKAPVASTNLAGWELIGPLFKAFETAAGGGKASMALPEPQAIDRRVPGGLQLMEHQAQFLAAVRTGHRSFLLADEPGLGKTAQALIAAQVAGAYPLLAVVPNVVKINWKREVERWTPNRRATVIHGDGEDLDAFADVVIVNYDILDRHIGWLSRLGFKGMVIDEAHFIKNKESQRSKHVLKLSENIRLFARASKPLMVALTGTPLINSIEDFRMIWRYLGWIDEKKPTAELMEKLEAIGLTPLDFGFLPAARQAVIEMGIVRRRKVDVAADLPSRRVADMPVELDDSQGHSVRQAELELAARLLRRYQRIKSARVGTEFSEAELIRSVAMAELEESKNQSGSENVFTMIRKIGEAKAALAADYTAQLVQSVGKVVFFAKHIAVMDTAEAVLAKRGLKTVSLRGNQAPAERQAAIDAFTNDPEVSVIVCSLTAAGVGVNLQVASNVVLAELSWTAAEQTQAIDRVHRIGQEEPVTAWRILASHTIDTKIAELIDSKAGLAARALDGEKAEAGAEDNIQLSALMHLLESALKS